MNKYIFFTLLLPLVLGTACRSPQPASMPVSSIESEDSFVDAESFIWFMELIEEKVHLPNDLIQTHTLIAKPYGQFAGKEMRPVTPTIQAVILEQQSSLCTSYFLLTTDGAEVIDQRLLAEVCDWSPASDQRTYTQYDFVSSDEILVKHVSEEMNEEQLAVQSKDAFVYQITGNGKIEKCLTAR
ncbi:MAG: hypothetical protein AAF587_36640 [Bacteroidota bacterium]